MAIRAVFWDIGGVLVRTEDRLPRQVLAESLGKSSQELEEFVFSNIYGLQAQLGKARSAEYWRLVTDALSLPEEQITSFRRQFFAGDRLDMDLVRYIRSLRPRYRTGIISNANDDTRPLLTTEWKIADAFDTLVISAEVGAMKPDPRIYCAALQALEVTPEEAVFVDDVLENVAGAQAVGMHAIQFGSPAQVRQDLQALLKLE